MKINVGGMGGEGERLRAMQRKRGQIERKKTKRGTKRQRKRGKTLLTSTEGHREKEVTMSFFRIQESSLIWALDVLFI